MKIEPKVIHGYASEDIDDEFIDAPLPEAPKRERGAPVMRLSQAQVIEIRARYARWKRKNAEWQRFNKTYGRAEIAKAYGITERYLNKVLCHDVWTTAGFKNAGGKAGPLRGVCNWGAMEVDGEGVLYPCRDEDRAYYVMRFVRAAWAWRKRNNSSYKFRVRQTTGGVIIRRIA